MLNMHNAVGHFILLRANYRQVNKSNSSHLNAIRRRIVMSTNALSWLMLRCIFTSVHSQPRWAQHHDCPFKIYTIYQIHLDVGAMSVKSKARYINI